MKRNAIVRIVFFSISILLLLGILTAAITYDLLSDKKEVIEGPVAYSDEGSTGVVGAEKIRELCIEWAAGSITILPGESTDSIRFWDDYSGDEKLLLYYTITNDTLKIQFCEDDVNDLDFGIHFGSSLSKNLVVEVPRDWLCEKLEIDAAAATLEFHDLTIQEVDIDTASGACGFENCKVDTLDIDTASGDVIYTGTLNAIDCDGASASIVLNLTNIPSRIDMDTASGNLDITLPENAGFTASVEGLSTRLKSDFAYDQINGRYICGDGSCRIDVSAMSGNVYIRNNSNLTAADVTVPDEIVSQHDHDESCYADVSNCAYYFLDYHYHSESCSIDPSTCPYYLLGGHAHSNACVNDPVVCPYFTMEGHQHTEACVCNSENCPYYTLGSHQHSDNCNTNPDSCPDNTNGTHVHTDSCVTNSSACPNHNTNAQHAQDSGEHHNASSDHH